MQASLVVNSKSMHPFIGKRVPSPLEKYLLYCNSLSLETVPFVRDHCVADRIVVPGVCYLEAVLAAGCDI